MISLSRFARVAIILLAASSLVAHVVLERMTPWRRPPGPEPIVTLYRHGSGQKLTISMEEYVAGVVAAEMDPRWPVEALAAQAVLARTFAVERLAAGGVRKVHGTDLCDDPGHFQAYDGKAVNTNVRRAVARTRGLILTYGGRPAHAFYHAHSGGYTASPLEGVDFRGDAPYLQARPDVYSGSDYRWKAWLTPEEVRRAAGRVGVQLGKITPPAVGREGPSGRALTLVFGGKEVPAARFRLEVDGGMSVKSTLLEAISIEGGRVVISGRGFGHGVGMSQFGARNMALGVHDFRSILSFYYPQAQLDRRW